MNKIILPSILVATVMIAGIFSFMPVQEATTVHNTLQNSQLEIRTVTSAAGQAVSATRDIRVDCVNDFVLVGMWIRADTNAAGADEAIDITNIEVNDEDYTDNSNPITPTDVADSDLTASVNIWAEIIEGNPEFSNGIATSGNPVDFDMADGSDGGALDGDETIIINAVVLTRADAANTCIASTVAD